MDVTLSAGLTQDARADATVSPLHYQGLAPEYALTLGHRATRWDIAATIDGGSTPMISADSGSGSARLDHGGFRLTVLRSESTPPLARGFAVGATLSARGDITAMRYDDTQSTVQHFGFGYAALGPTVRWLVGAPGGSARIELGTPLVALIDRPYSDLKSEPSVFALRGGTPARFRAADGSIAYALGGFLLAYRFNYLRYDDSSPLRGVSQSFSLGVRSTFGGGRQ